MISDDEYISPTIARGHEWDAWMCRAVRMWHKRGKSILDVGANIGHSIVFRKWTCYIIWTCISWESRCFSRGLGDRGGASAYSRGLEIKALPPLSLGASMTSKVPQLSLGALAIAVGTSFSIPTNPIPRRLRRTMRTTWIYTPPSTAPALLTSELGP